MFGTVARLKIKPGMRALFQSWARYSSLTQRTIPGIVESIILQADDDANIFLMIVVFENREVYRANADSLEQHEEYLRMMEFISGPPEWNDGDVIWEG